MKHLDKWYTGWLTAVFNRIETEGKRIVVNNPHHRMNLVVTVFAIYDCLCNLNAGARYGNN